MSVNNYSGILVDINTGKPVPNVQVMEMRLQPDGVTYAATGNTDYTDAAGNWALTMDSASQVQITADAYDTEIDPLSFVAGKTYSITPSTVFSISTNWILIGVALVVGFLAYKYRNKIF